MSYLVGEDDGAVSVNVSVLEGEITTGQVLVRFETRDSTALCKSSYIQFTVEQFLTNNLEEYLLYMFRCICILRYDFVLCYFLFSSGGLFLSG